MAREDRDRGEKKFGKSDFEDDKKRVFSSPFGRKKVCRFCTDREAIMDYKNVRMVQSFVTEHGKIVPSRISGNCALHQRQLTIAVKRARQLAFVGYVSAGI